MDVHMKSDVYVKWTLGDDEPELKSNKSPLVIFVSGTIQTTLVIFVSCKRFNTRRKIPIKISELAQYFCGMFIFMYIYFT